MSSFRKIAPSVHSVEKIDFIEPAHQLLPGGTSFFTLYGGTQEVVKLDFSFKAGNWYGNAKLESIMAASMIGEGTSGKTAREIADKIDFYGAQLSSLPYYDNNYVSLLALKKHLRHLLPLLAEIMQDASFPEHEFEIARQKRKQRALVDAEKVGLVAQRNFMRNLMGEGHPYAPVASPDSYDHITLEAAKSHYNRHYCSANATLFASGDVDEEVRKLIVENFGENWGTPYPFKKDQIQILSSTEKNVFIERDNANQNAITIGKLVPTQHHPDSSGLKLLTTIFGGYFGSRLMSNLREEKGLTYGIHASVVSFVRDAIFMIHAEVTAEKTDQAIKEIFLEMQRLRDELVPESELEPLRSFLLGRMLEDFDGPFARSQSFSSLYEAGLEVGYFDNIIHTIKSTTPEQIRELARTYFDPESMFTVAAGKK
ncbi:MAG: pitrilysin family protein [Prolixibacteraceae bacterium]